jgi:hypothetical protein
MVAASVVTSALLAAILAASAIRKLGHQPQVVQTYVRVGVPEEKLDYLAYILLAGAAGLVLGVFWAPIGVAAAAAVVVYFVLAMTAHVRAGDQEHLPTPVVIEAIAVAALVLRVATL